VIIGPRSASTPFPTSAAEAPETPHDAVLAERARAQAEHVRRAGGEAVDSRDRSATRLAGGTLIRLHRGAPTPHLTDERERALGVRRADARPAPRRPEPARPIHARERHETVTSGAVVQVVTARPSGLYRTVSSGAIFPQQYSARASVTAQ
jgi:hypothetical protein